LGDLGNYGSAARGRPSLHRVAEAYISSQLAKKTSMETTQKQSVVMNFVTRPLSPDSKIEIQARWAEYEYAHEYLDNEGNK
ncbi:hypothetical protein V1508DRAFT_358586, partial [Lipomyces doorenjongii]|uniref:uncharacterized protein n=1 Tax=Lipomyces doorenjongii TaxID=383834 RepID=UPI0034CF0282